MTETEDEQTGVESTIDEAESGTHADPGDGGRSEEVVRYVHWGLLAVLLLVTLVATFRFYFAVSEAIDNFVTREFRPLFQAAFNLAILLACGVGLSVLVRRIR